MSAYGHDICKIASDHYRLSWAVDRKYANSRLRFPTSFQRDTDEAGAKRFAKKWDVTVNFSEAKGTLDNKDCGS